MNKIKKQKPAFLKIVICAVYFLVVTFMPKYLVYAEEEYVIISIDAEDDNPGLTYALDSIDPEAFGPEKEFRVLKGTAHTIYVKDEAGNITAREYSTISVDKDKKNDAVNLDIEIGENNQNYTPGSYGTGTGTGTLTSKVKTDGSDSGEKIFYTVEAADGSVFYLIIDQGNSSNNVYFLDTVKISDLASLAEDDAGIIVPKEKETKSDGLLSSLSDEKVKAIEAATDGTGSSSSSGSKKSTNGMAFLILTVMAIGFGIYYYFKIYSKKKDEALDLQDAYEMDDFEGEYEEDEYDYDYEENEEDKDEEEEEINIEIIETQAAVDDKEMYENGNVEDIENEDVSVSEELASGQPFSFAKGISETIIEDDGFDEFGDNEEE